MSLSTAAEFSLFVSQTRGFTGSSDGSMLVLAGTWRLTVRARLRKGVNEDLLDISVFQPPHSLGLNLCSLLSFLHVPSHAYARFEHALTPY